MNCNVSLHYFSPCTKRFRKDVSFIKTLERKNLNVERKNVRRIRTLRYVHQKDDSVNVTSNLQINAEAQGPPSLPPKRNNGFGDDENDNHNNRNGFLFALGSALLVIIWTAMFAKVQNKELLEIIKDSFQKLGVLKSKRIVNEGALNNLRGYETIDDKISALKRLIRDLFSELLALKRQIDDLSSSFNSLLPTPSSPSSPSTANPSFKELNRRSLHFPLYGSAVLPYPKTLSDSLTLRSLTFLTSTVEVLRGAVVDLDPQTRRTAPFSSTTPAPSPALAKALVSIHTVWERSKATWCLQLLVEPLTGLSHLSNHISHCSGPPGFSSHCFESVMSHHSTTPPRIQLTKAIWKKEIGPFARLMLAMKGGKLDNIARNLNPFAENGISDFMTRGHGLGGWGWGALEGEVPQRGDGMYDSGGGGGGGDQRTVSPSPLPLCLPSSSFSSSSPSSPFYSPSSPLSAAATLGKGPWSLTGGVFGSNLPSHAFSPPLPPPHVAVQTSYHLSRRVAASLVAVRDAKVQGLSELSETLRKAVLGKQDASRESEAHGERPPQRPSLLSRGLSCRSLGFATSANVGNFLIASFWVCGRLLSQPPRFPRQENRGVDFDNSTSSDNSSGNNTNANKISNDVMNTSAGQFLSSIDQRQKNLYPLHVSSPTVISRNDRKTFGCGFKVSTLKDENGREFSLGVHRSENKMIRFYDYQTNPFVNQSPILRHEFEPETAKNTTTTVEVNAVLPVADGLIVIPGVVITHCTTKTYDKDVTTRKGEEEKGHGNSTSMFLGAKTKWSF